MFLAVLAFNTWNSLLLSAPVSSASGSSVFIKTNKKTIFEQLNI